MSGNFVGVKKDTGHYLDIELKDSVSYVLETGVAAGSVSLSYYKQGVGPGAYVDIGTPGSWMERGYGHFQAYLGGTFFDTVGDFHFVCNGTGFLTHRDVVTVKYFDEHSPHLEVLGTNHSTPFTKPWVMKMIYDRLAGNFAEVDRTIGADGLDETTFKFYDFTGTDSAEAGNDNDIIGTGSVTVLYSGGARTLFSQTLDYPVFSE